MKMNLTRQTWRELKPLYDDLNAKKRNFMALKVPFRGLKTKWVHTAFKTEKKHTLLLTIILCQRSRWPKRGITLSFIGEVTELLTFEWQICVPMFPTETAPQAAPQPQSLPRLAADMSCQSVLTKQRTLTASHSDVHRQCLGGVTLQGSQEGGVAFTMLRIM